MARGRMINNKICMNKAINDLSDDTSRLAFTWLVTFADVAGRTHGDPALLRSLLFPRRADISVEQMESYVTEWAEAGLIQWYEANGDLWIAFPKFGDNQRGLDTRHEPVSEIPAPNVGTEHRLESVVCTDVVPADVSVVPVQRTGVVPLNRNELNRNEVEVKARLFELVKQAGIIVSQSMAEHYNDLLEIAPIGMIENVFQEAAATGARPYPKWVKSVLERCVRDGLAPGVWKAHPAARASPPLHIPDSQLVWSNDIPPETIRQWQEEADRGKSKRKSSQPAPV